MTFFRATILSLFLAVFSYSQAADSSSTPLVDTAWLAENIDHVVILDIRASKKSYATKPVFNKDKKTGKTWLARVGGHIPSAQLIVYKNVRGDRSIDGKTIKHMAVTSEKFEKIMRDAGVNQDSHVVITTNAESGFDLTMASRMYWQVKYYGHNAVSILNGGTAQWIIDGRNISTSASHSEPGNWKAQAEVSAIFADSEEVNAAMDNPDLQLVDVRPLGQYLGTFKSGKAKAKGHIPSAKVFPIDLLSSRSTPVKFSSATELKQLSKALGIDDQKPLITYCNSGHMASGSWFVFHEILGNNQVKLYDGSMHQWTHEDRPVVSMIVE